MKAITVIMFLILPVQVFSAKCPNLQYNFNCSTYYNNKLKPLTPPYLVGMRQALKNGVTTYYRYEEGSHRVPTVFIADGLTRHTYGAQGWLSSLTTTCIPGGFKNYQLTAKEFPSETVYKFDGKTLTVIADSGWSLKCEVVK